MASNLDGAAVEWNTDHVVAVSDSELTIAIAVVTALVLLLIIARRSRS